MALGKNCHHLKILEASCCSRFTDAGFNALSKGCHLIERMDLEECNKITDLTLKYLSFNCPKLKHLVIKFKLSKNLLQKILFQRIFLGVNV